MRTYLGLYLSIYVKKTIAHRINSLETDIVKTGFKGTVGNKGAVLIKFKVDDTEVKYIP